MPIGEIYEYAVFQSIEEKDIRGFQRNYTTLNFYYNELRDVLPESSKKNSVLGLYLLYLLSQNKISEFHVELQAIPSSDHSNIYINVPVSLEQYFVDGNYAKVLATKNVPLDAYNFFIEKFIDTVRTEIARSVEVSYEKLSLKDACEIFMLDNVDQLQRFVETQSDINAEDRTISWVIKDDNLHFTTINVEKEGIPAKKMMAQVLEYAHELQRIV
jgi:26S proteasome regulatory subunit N12